MDQSGRSRTGTAGCLRLGHIGVADGDEAITYPGDIWHYARHRLVAARSAEVDQALGAIRAIRAVREAEAQGLGAATDNGVRIDAATARVFQVTVDRAHSCGLL